jgi:hypothetical protein
MSANPNTPPLKIKPEMDTRERGKESAEREVLLPIKK